MESIIRLQEQISEFGKGKRNSDKDVKDMHTEYYRPWLKEIK